MYNTKLWVLHMLSYDNQLFCEKKRKLLQLSFYWKCLTFCWGGQHFKLMKHSTAISWYNSHEKIALHRMLHNKAITIVLVTASALHESLPNDTQQYPLHWYFKDTTLIHPIVGTFEAGDWICHNSDSKNYLLQDLTGFKTRSVIKLLA